MMAAPVPNKRLSLGLLHSGHFFFTGSVID
jgi:hypothetical protein